VGHSQVEPNVTTAPNGLDSTVRVVIAGGVVEGESVTAIAGKSAEQPWWRGLLHLAQPGNGSVPSVQENEPCAHGVHHGARSGNGFALADGNGVAGGSDCAVEIGLPAAWADSWFRREALAAPPADLAEPFSLPWFLALEYQRHHRHGRWLAEVLEFRRHSGETVLAIGHALGTDWVQYARYGARVIVCSPTAEELEVIRQQFQLRGLSGAFVHAAQPPLPLPNDLADLACVQRLLCETRLVNAWLAEVRRVLKPGGKLLVLESAEELARQYGWSGIRQLRSLLADFESVKIRRHHLPRREIAWWLRWLPRRWLERLLGRFLLIRAVKPITSPTLQRAAA
jgi:ubiquinone/menaquinone biosynthesis C-methylase UbiE